MSHLFATFFVQKTCFFQKWLMICKKWSIVTIRVEKRCRGIRFQDGPLGGRGAVWEHFWHLFSKVKSLESYGFYYTRWTWRSRLVRSGSGQGRAKFTSGQGVAARNPPLPVPGGEGFKRHVRMGLPWKTHPSPFKRGIVLCCVLCILLCFVVLCCIVLCCCVVLFCMLCCVVLCCIVLCCVALCCVVVCCVVFDQIRSGQIRSGQRSSGHVR